MAEAYCVKCKTKREIVHPEATFTAKGTPGVKGSCPVCGTTLFRMGATEAHAGLPKPVIAPSEKTAKSNGSVKGKAAAAKKKPAAKTKTKTAKSKNGAAPRSIGKLVIVESPAKARSVTNYLGKGFTVKASVGHVRDLLASQLSVDVEKDFEPKYRVPNEKRAVVKELKAAVAAADEVFLATDPDREGEAIAWHLIHATEGDEEKMKRVTFNEITPQAVKDAFQYPREIDMNLVNAQQARRILDRLVGYPVSELLWEKVRNGLSAGRVQSVAVRLIVDREREIETFVPQEYWTLDARLRKSTAANKDDQRPFIAHLVKINDQDVGFHVEGDVAPHLPILQRSDYTVIEVKRGERQRKPSAPFTTSTLQQEASRRLGFTAQRTMATAQQLYEGVEVGSSGSTGGLITYMRTDSTNVSAQAQTEARHYIEQRFGKGFMPERPPQYRTRAKNAQEAHEAIRPTDVTRTPESLKGQLKKADHLKLYTLIWQRFVASQMANAIYNTLRVDIGAGEGGKQPYLFRVSGSTIKFPGFLALYEDAHDEDIASDEDEGRVLPEMAVGDKIDLLDLLPEQHFTQPPPRFTEASLVRTLEEYGIGRPSTYASTVGVIQKREYVTKVDKRLKPTDTGKTVTDLLMAYFPQVMDYQFTARMEDELDEIAEGDLQWRPMLGDFYQPFAQQLDSAREKMPVVKEMEYVGRDCPVCGNPLVVRYGRSGKFIGCSTYPQCTHTEPFLERLGIACPKCGKEHGGEVVRRVSKRGRVFFGCARYPQCDFTSWKRPLAQPCANCGGLLVEQSRKIAVCTVCNTKYQMEALEEASMEPA
ncbi:MAG: type I DNA topoisomerase [Chloroflexota bacterium]|nr:type I DNA topoisomerase [Chloroflexota bacterium]